MRVWAQREEKSFMEEVTFEPGLEQFGIEDAFSGEKIL